MDESAALAVLADPAVDEEAAWNAIHALRNIASRSVLNCAKDLTRSSEASIRARAANVLGQLGVPNRTYPDECLEALVALLEDERDDDVIDAAIIALGHLEHPNGLKTIIRFANHRNPEIRYAVAFALGGRTEGEALSALTALMEDSEPKVRDWATFGIGTLGSVNTSQIRDALVLRMADADEQTRFEALAGLAHYGDARAIQPLIDGLVAEPENFLLWPLASKLLGIDINAEESSARDLIGRLERLRDD